MIHWTPGPDDYEPAPRKFDVPAIQRAFLHNALIRIAVCSLAVAGLVYVSVAQSAPIAAAAKARP